MSALQTQNNVEAEIVTADGTTYQTRFTRLITWDRDGNYGADADGNRGVERFFHESDEVEDIEIVTGPEDNRDFSPLKNESPNLQLQVEAAILEWCAENIPSECDIDEAPDPEPDEDR